jgi:hypothetical protein
MALSLDGTTGISATGNIISSGGIISATGNIYGGNIIGTIAPSAITVSGNATVGNLLTGGLISATGTITGSSHLGSVVSVTANVTGGNLLTGGLISATGTITGTSYLGSVVSVTANVTGGNLLTSGLISAAANVTAPYFIGNGAALSGLSASKIFNGTSEANIGTSGGNANITIGGTSNVVVVATTGAYITGIVSATGNVTAPYFIGNGAALSGLSASKIFNGTSEANIGASGGNANITIGGTSNVFVVASTGIYTTGLSSVSGNVTGGNFLTGGLISATGNITGGNLSGTSIVGTLTTASQTNITSVGTLGSLAVTANVTGGNLLTGGLISATSTITGTSHLGSVVSVTANVTGGNVLTGGLISATGAIQVGGDMSLVGNIVDTGALWINTTANGNITLNANGTGVITFNNPITNGQANGIGNIGNSTGYFNRLFAQATTALYADLAEVYKADAQYPPGTVLVFGGTQEVTMSTESHDVKIAGVVSTHPAHVMNSGLQSEFTVEVGLIGRVPCRVIGPIAAGDRVVSSNRAGVAERLDMSRYQPGVIIGKAVESYSGLDVGTIEVVVGRL